MKNENKSLMELHLAVMLFGLSSVIGRFITVPAVLVAGGRVLCSALLLLGMAIVRKKPLQLKSRKDGLLAVITGVILACHWTAFFQSAKVASVAVATITFSTFPLFLTILEPAVFHEKIRPGYIAGGVIMLAGVLIMMPGYSMDDPVTAGILWGMVSSVAYALMTLCNRSLSGRYDAGVLCLYEQGTAAVLLLPAFFFIKVQWTVSDAGWIIVLGTVCTALAHSLYVCAQKRVKAQTAGMIAGMESVYGIAYAWLFLGEVPSWRETVGGLIVLGVAFVFSVRRSHKNKNHLDDGFI